MITIQSIVELGTLNTKTSCYVIRVLCISIQTRKPKVETQNKHEKSRIMIQTRKQVKTRLYIHYAKLI